MIKIENSALAEKLVVNFQTPLSLVSIYLGCQYWQCRALAGQRGGYYPTEKIGAGQKNSLKHCCFCWNSKGRADRFGWTVFSEALQLEKNDDKMTISTNFGKAVTGINCLSFSLPWVGPKSVENWLKASFLGWNPSLIDWKLML